MVPGQQLRERRTASACALEQPDPSDKVGMVSTYSPRQFLLALPVGWYFTGLLHENELFITVGSQKEAEVKEQRSVFDIPIFTEEFLNHSKGDY